MEGVNRNCHDMNEVLFCMRGGCSCGMVVVWLLWLLWWWPQVNSRFADDIMGISALGDTTSSLLPCFLHSSFFNLSPSLFCLRYILLFVALCVVLL